MEIDGDWADGLHKKAAADVLDKAESGVPAPPEAAELEALEPGAQLGKVELLADRDCQGGQQ